MLQMFVLALSLYNTWNRGVFLLCKITNLLIYSTKNNIYESIWNEEFFGEENAINVHISNIRKKLSEINKNEQYIETVRGIGFRLWRI